MTLPSTDVSILLVNWNSIQYLRPCLASIYEHTKKISFEIIVVDNASYDGCSEMLRKEFPGAIFIQSDENLGFSRANNLAFQRSSGAALLFLNPDTLVLNPAIEMMHATLNSAPRIGAVGCGVLNYDRSLQMHYVQASPTLLNQLLLSEFAKRKLPRSRLWGVRPLIEYSGKPMEVEVVMGSCMMVKRPVFEEIGLFDERYFMFAEDVDLCHSIRKHGYSIYYVREGSVIHYGGKSSELKEESHFSTILQRESISLFFSKTKGKAYSWLYRSGIGLAAMFRLVLIAAATPFRRGEFHRERLMMASRKWVTLLRWSMGSASLTTQKGGKLNTKVDNC
jgi:GT2 family glycosyltransferase